MSKPYFTENQKMVHLSEVESWTIDDCLLIHEILYGKGYFVNHCMRIGADREWHEALQVEREDVPRLVEQFFRQRIVAEYQAEGKGKAAIIFVYDYPVSTIIRAVEKFQKNKGDDIYD